jgi:hypothetical protein
METAIEICTQVFDDVPVSLGSSWDDGQPRIRDTDLALALGMAQPRDIRKLIKRHEGTPEFGEVCLRATVARKHVGPYGGGSSQYEVDEYWLLDWQALFIASKSETKAGACILAKMSKAFVSARTFVPAGIVAISNPQQSEDMLKAIMVMAKASVDSIAEVRAMRIDAEKHRSHAEQSFHTIRVVQAEQGATIARVEKRVEELAISTGNRRIEFPNGVRINMRRCVLKYYGGKCPCCGDVQMITSLHGNTNRLQYDHWFSVNRAGALDGWPVCDKCNLELGHAGETNNPIRESRRPDFSKFQRHLRELLGYNVVQLKISGANLWPCGAQ